MVSAVSNLSWSYEEYGILFHHVLSRFLRVWDYPNKQKCPRRSKSSAGISRKRVLVCCACYVVVFIRKRLFLSLSAFCLRRIFAAQSGQYFVPIAARRKRAAAYRATLQIGFPAAGDLFA